MIQARCTRLCNGLVCCLKGLIFSNVSGSSLPAWRGRSPLGVPFDRAKGTKTRLGRSPLRTSLGLAALWLWNNPNRPWGKLILLCRYIRCRSPFQCRRHLPQKNRACRRWWQPACSQSRRCYQRNTVVLRGRCQRQRRKENRQFSLPQRRWRMRQRHARRPQGVPRGDRPRRFFGDFLIGEKVTLRSKP